MNAPTFHVFTPTYRPAGGVVKIFDYVTHMLSTGYQVALYCPEEFSEKHTIFSIDRFEHLATDPRVRYARKPDHMLGDFDRIFISAPTSFTLAHAMLSPRMSPERLVHVIQGVRHTTPTWLDGMGTRLLGRPMSRIAINAAVRDRVADWVDERGFMRTIDLGHDLEFFSSRRRYRDDGQLRVGYTTWKSDVGIEVEDRLGTANFEFRSIRKTASWSELRDLYRWADVFLSTPNLEEGLYMPGLEAMAAGAIVVTPDAAGNMAYCKPEVNCLLVDHGDVDGYVAALERVSQMPVGAVRELQEAGWAEVENFDITCERAGFEQFVLELDKRIVATEGAPYEGNGGETARQDDVEAYGGEEEVRQRGSEVEPPRVAVIALPQSPSRWVRTVPVARLANESLLAEVEFVDPLEFIAGCNERRWQSVVVQRQAVKPQEVDQFLSVVAENGVRLVVELDDDLVSDAGFAALELRGGFDRPRLDALRKIVRAADACTASTRTLARRIRDVVPGMPVEIFPNRIDPTVWSVDDGNEVIPEDNVCRILYFGTETHSGDIRLVEKLPAELTERLGQPVEIEVFGGASDLPSGFVRYGREGVPYPEFVAALAAGRNRWRVGIAPLCDDPINRSKSDLKLLELAALGLPVVASQRGPYANAEHLATLVDDTNEQWADAVEGLLVDEPRAAEQATDAASWVGAFRTMDIEFARRWTRHVVGPREVVSTPNKSSGLVVASTERKQGA